MAVAEGQLTLDWFFGHVEEEPVERQYGPWNVSYKMDKWALWATVSEWKKAGLTLPADGIITYVNEKKVQSENPGYCYIRAGFKKLKIKSKYYRQMNHVYDFIPFIK
jgi:hypothetical protein